jgi:hypothetical protein
MNPVVEAALIAGGTTAIVGVVGFRTTLAVTRQTLDAARDDRLWDKRASAYEAALTELANRAVRREHAIRLAENPNTAPETLAEYFATQETPAWSEAEGRLLAYSSKKVSRALEAVRSADDAASEGFEPLRKAVTTAEELRGNDGSLPAQEVYVERTIPAFNKMTSMMRDCRKADTALIDLIRSELLPTAERKSPSALPR